MSMQKAILELRRLNREAVCGFAQGDVERVARLVVAAFLGDHDAPCHADVLLEIANQIDGETP